MKTTHEILKQVASGETSPEAALAMINAAKRLQQVKDRFFLDEIIFRLGDQFERLEEYPRVLLSDWMFELIRANPLIGEKEQVGIQFQGEEWREYYHETDEELLVKIGYSGMVDTF